MRGQQIRILPNLEIFKPDEQAWENDLPLPELHDNTRLILECAQAGKKT